jgi:hypothetical protein
MKTSHLHLLTNLTAMRIFAPLDQTCSGGSKMNDFPVAKYYGRGDRAYVQAQQLWLVLVSYVMNAKQRGAKVLPPVSYGELATLIGKDPRAGRNLRTALGVVGVFCKLNDLPTLNSIVVNEETGVPGDHVILRDGYTVAQEQKAVMRQDWFAIRVPTTGALRKAWEQAEWRL